MTIRTRSTRPDTKTREDKGFAEGGYCVLVFRRLQRENAPPLWKGTSGES